MILNGEGPEVGDDARSELTAAEYKRAARWIVTTSAFVVTNPSYRLRRRQISGLHVNTSGGCEAQPESGTRTLWPG